MQTVKGRVMDKESHMPLAHVRYWSYQCTYRQRDHYRQQRCFTLRTSVGRQSLLCTTAGYHDYVGRMMVISGKETFLTIEMQESVEKMQEVIVQAAEKETDPSMRWLR